MLKGLISGDHGHRLLVSDPGMRRILEFAEDGTVLRILPTFGEGLSYDAWLLPDGDCLYANMAPDGTSTVVRCDGGGDPKMIYRTPYQVFSCQPYPDGGFLCGELQGARLVECDSRGTVTRIIPIRTVKACHNTMRMCRRLPDGTYLVNQPEDRVIRRYEADGRIVWELATAGDTFAVVPDTESGGVYYTGKQEIFRVAADGSVLWHAAEADLALIHPCWLTGMELLPNGHLLVANWLGHGMAGKGAPLFEITPSREIVWTLSAPDFTDCMANLQSLARPLDLSAAPVR